MQFQATKSDYDRQQEEDERLVRPSPKDKPPRRDLRRERVSPDSDPDLDDASDQKDRSKNYKNVGGSLVLAATDLVPAKNRETGKIVRVSPETLKSESGKYEAVDPESEEEGTEPEVEKPGVREPEAKEPPNKAKFYGEAGRALRELAVSNPKLENKLRSFSTPGSDLSGFAKENPDFPAAQLFPGIDLPKGLNTLGDIKQALEHADRLPKPKKKKKAPAVAVEDSPQSPSSEPPPEETSSEPPPEEPSKVEAPKAKTPKAKTPKAKTPKAKTPEIPVPKRRPFSAVEREEALSLLVDTFPPEAAAKLVASDLHPDDVKTIARDYLAAKKGARPGNLPSFAAKVREFYEEDLDKVKPPVEGRSADGKTVPFEELSPEEKAETNRQHQLRVTALSMAAREVMTDRVMDVRAISGTPRIPRDVASKIVSALLAPKASEDAYTKSYDEFLTSGEKTNKIDSRTAEALLSRVAGSPGAREVAKAYLQANDYHVAKDRFLKGDDESISEWQEPKDILRGLKRVGAFFDERNALYGDSGEHPSAGFFRLKVLQRLKALNPRKARAVTESLPELEQEEYEKRHKEWAKQKAEWEKRRDLHEKEQKDFSEEPPVEPPPPLHQASTKESGKALWRSMFKGLGKKSHSSTYQAECLMAVTSGKTSVYHGVDPYAYGSSSYPGWLQPHQRDFDSSDFAILIQGAREWLESPLLSIAVEGMQVDARLRAALDLAIYASPYNGQVQPTLYNELLAVLAKVPTPGQGETLLTVQDKKSFALEEITFRTSAPVNEGVLEAVRKASFSYRDKTGATHADGHAAVRQHQNDKIAIDFPEGSGGPAIRAIQAALEPLGVRITSIVTADQGAVKSASEELRRFASQVADAKLALEMLECADRVASEEGKASSKEASDKYAIIKPLIIKHAASLGEFDRVPLIPVLQAIKNLA